jgi:hypothetical protein
MWDENDDAPESTAEKGNSWEDKHGKEYVKSMPTTGTEDKSNEQHNLSGEKRISLPCVIVTLFVVVAIILALGFLVFGFIN